jgi:ActR/RegA family two-component response regulator
MGEGSKRDWRELAQLAAAEQDPQKLLKIVTELNAALMDRQRKAPSSWSRRVLVADDDPIVSRTLVPILRQRGFESDVVATVSDALNLIESQVFDVLICDLNIAQPRDGFVIVTAMRKAHPQSVIVLLTGYPGFDTAVEGIRQDVDDYFVKPADYEVLISTLEKRVAAKRIAG